MSHVFVELAFSVRRERRCEQKAFTHTPREEDDIGDNVIKAIFKRKRTVKVFEKQSKRKRGRGIKKKNRRT